MPELRISMADILALVALPGLTDLTVFTVGSGLLTAYLRGATIRRQDDPRTGNIIFTWSA